jgi:hypothetical protein
MSSVAPEASALADMELLPVAGRSALAAAGDCTSAALKALDYRGSSRVSVSAAFLGRLLGRESIRATSHDLPLALAALSRPSLLRGALRSSVRWFVVQQSGLHSAQSQRCSRVLVGSSMGVGAAASRKLEPSRSRTL